MKKIITSIACMTFLISCSNKEAVMHEVNLTAIDTRRPDKIISISGELKIKILRQIQESTSKPGSEGIGFFAAPDLKFFIKSKNGSLVSQYSIRGRTVISDEINKVSYQFMNGKEVIDLIREYAQEGGG